MVKRKFKCEECGQEIEIDLCSCENVVVKCKYGDKMELIKC